MKAASIYEFHAELYDFKPTIWRRFQVPGDISIASLAYVVMILFEMRASHLFSVEREPESESDIPDCYRIPSSNPEFDFGDEKPKDATATRLERITSEIGVRFGVNYDFGDDWFVVLELEKILREEESSGEKLPRVLAGKGFGIVEDCGGTIGLEELAKAFASKKGPRYKECREWLGSDFDIEAFDIDDMNFRLQKVPRIYKQIYEDKRYPSQRSIDLIERKYLKKK